MIEHHATTSNAYENLLTDTAKNSYDLEVGGRLLDSMSLGAQDSDLFNRESAQWEQAVKEGDEKDSLDKWKDIFSLFPEGDKGWAFAQAALGLDPGPGQNPATIAGGDIMRTLIENASPTENTALHRGAILDGLIQKDPSIASDPSLAQFLTDGNLDPDKVRNSTDAPRIIARWFDNNSDLNGVSESDWKTAIDHGRENDNWG